MFDKIKKLFKEKCYFCRKSVNDAVVELKAKDGKQLHKICDECAFFFEKSVEAAESKGKNDVED